MGSTTQYRHRYRCSNTRKCGFRFTLNKKKKRPAADLSCPMCKGRVYSDERNRRNEMKKAALCQCYPIPFPHRKGSILGCDHHPVHPDSFTFEQKRQYESMLRTPRSG